MTHLLWLVWHFLWTNGIGQNLLASGILGTLGLLNIRRLLQRHHEEQLALHRKTHELMRKRED